MNRRRFAFFYLEDNPLIIFHVEAMIDDLGHIFAGSADKFHRTEANDRCVQVRRGARRYRPGRRSNRPCRGLVRDKGIPVLFVTGQEAIAAEFSGAALGLVRKPVASADLAAKLELFRR